MNTVSGTAAYALSGLGTRSNVLYIHNETDNAYIKQESLQRIRELALGTEMLLVLPTTLLLKALTVMEMQTFVFTKHQIAQRQ